MPKKYEILKTTKPLTEGEVDPIYQMCLDIENDGNPNTSAIYDYGSIGLGMKVTKVDIEEIRDLLNA